MNCAQSNCMGAAWSSGYKYGYGSLAAGGWILVRPSALCSICVLCAAYVYYVQHMLSSKPQLSSVKWGYQQYLADKIRLLYKSTASCNSSVGDGEIGILHFLQPTNLNGFDVLYLLPSLFSVLMHLGTWDILNLYSCYTNLP